VKNVLIAKHTIAFFAYLLVVWGFYRMLLQVPDPFDEGLVKPLVWLIPLYFLLKRERKGSDSLGITEKNMFRSIYFALFLGAAFAIEGVFINFAKYKGFNFNTSVTQGMFISTFVISIITAVTEELVFRGYLFSRVWDVSKKEIQSNLLVSAGWAVLHLPLAIFDWQLSVGPLMVYLFLLFVFGCGASFIYAKTRNILAPIILHVLWAWPILLFR
jgi:hypothetical protein